MSECKCNLREKLVGDGCRETIEELTQQRDMLLDALKPIIEYPGIREYIGSILADKARAVIAAVEGDK